MPKLFLWLNKLSETELDDLMAFAAQPSLSGHNLNCKILAAYRNEIRLSHPEETLLTRIQNRVWPGREISKKYWEKLASIFIATIKQFLVWQQIRGDQGHQQLTLLKFFSDQDMETDHNRVWRNFEFLAAEQAPYSEDWMRKEVEARKIYAQNYYRFNTKPIELPLNQAIDAQLWHHRTEVLILTTARKNLRLARGASDDPGSDALIAELSPHSWENPPLLTMMYWLAYQLLDPTDGLVAYEELRRTLATTSNILPPRHNWDLYSYLINFAVRKMRNQELGYQVQIRELYEELLAGEKNPTDGIDPWAFRNMVVTMVRLGELTLAEDFFNRYQGHVNNDSDGNAVTYASATIEFVKGNYEVASRHLHRLVGQYRNAYYGVYGRWLLWKCLVELEDSIYLDNLLERFVRYFERTHLLVSGEKLKFKELFRWSCRMFNVPPGDKEELLKLLVRIREKTGEEYEWLAKKVEERLGNKV